MRACLLCVIALTVLVPATGEATSSARWKGAESMTPVALRPDVERCGDPSAALEARFAGEGIDNAGGPFSVAASGCLDPNRLRIFDLEATDTFLDGSGSLLITPHDAALVLDEDTCVATNVRPVPFVVTGGTGAFASATGRGTFHIALSWPPCGGIPAPARVWFSGSLTRDA
jgi:hypothetical protein